MAFHLAWCTPRVCCWIEVFDVAILAHTHTHTLLIPYHFINICGVVCKFLRPFTWSLCSCLQAPSSSRPLAQSTVSEGNGEMMAHCTLYYFYYICTLDLNSIIFCWTHYKRLVIINSVLCIKRVLCTHTHRKRESVCVCSSIEPTWYFIEMLCYAMPVRIHSRTLCLRWIGQSVSVKCWSSHQMAWCWANIKEKNKKKKGRMNENE